MVSCKGCGEQMASAPDHFDHEEACIKALLWKAIEAYCVAHRKHAGRVQAVKTTKAEIERLIGAGRFGYGT